jgi:hypothetical protein
MGNACSTTDLQSPLKLSMDCPNVMTQQCKLPIVCLQHGSYSPAAPPWRTAQHAALLQLTNVQQYMCARVCWKRGIVWPCMYAEEGGQSAGVLS